MKKILKPKQIEEAIYFSDFTGQPFDTNFRHPPVEVKMNFNYGSKYDGSEINLHLSDKDMEPILDLIQSKLNPDFRKSLEEDIKENTLEYNNAIDSKDPIMCDYYISCYNLFKRLLGDDKLD
jgi:hypothetical protein